MEHEAVVAITTKATSIEEPKWTTVITKNVRQVVNRAMETLADTHTNKRNTNSTYASRASRPRKVRLKRC
jgi:hypothetical protein